MSFWVRERDRLQNEILLALQDEYCAASAEGQPPQSGEQAPPEALPYIQFYDVARRLMPRRSELEVRRLYHAAVQRGTHFSVPLNRFCEVIQHNGCNLPKVSLEVGIGIFLQCALPSIGKPPREQSLLAPPRANFFCAPTSSPNPLLKRSTGGSENRSAWTERRLP